MHIYIYIYIYLYTRRKFYIYIVYIYYKMVIISVIYFIIKLHRYPNLPRNA